ncbi:hypothetical protein [Desulfonema magnum]|uniref:Outer membrane protein beta-barrel domain-containing protein n=1 Tax=Desulfonema magnum TaxID=45655 RepID=A0A975BI23_9BACT|nr:hypothetical protein [Desulfonema magnum]QTA85846.1 Uncharacterized protein dnm_018610 [Desulfonema magnum]
MSRTLLVICIALFINIIPGPGFAEVNLVVGITPGIFLYSPDAEGFRVSDGETIGEVEGYLSNLATLTAGVGINTPAVIIDLTGGLGYQYNNAFTSTLFLADAALRFKINREELTAGPHITIVKYDPSWDGDANISLSDDTGFIGGLGLTIGSKAFSISASLDYVSASFDVESPGISLNNEALDISGIAFQLGVILRF